jgi:L-lactate permease
MSLVAVLLALSPVIVVIFLLLILRHMAADTAGLIGWVFTVARGLALF